MTSAKPFVIPKKSGGERILGVPTVGDRIAQTVVTMTLEPILEPVFHGDSYGYRRGKSAHDALAVTRKRWVLANLFLRYALDRWLTANHKDIPFCRYADDGILHCRSEAEAHYLREQLAKRLHDCGLEMHPTKTRVVYCKDSRRTETHEQIQFDFLGYTFRPRRTVNRSGKALLGFTPAVSRQAMTAMRQSIRRWHLTLRSELSLDQLAQVVAPRVRG